MSTYEQVFVEFVQHYQSEFRNPPSSAQQLLNYCKQHSIPLKYGQVRQLFSKWSIISQKLEINEDQYQQPLTTTTTTDDDQEFRAAVTEKNDEKNIDWDRLWAEFTADHAYTPKKPMHLLNFARMKLQKDCKFMDARMAFERLSVKVDQQNKNAEGMDVSIDISLSDTDCKQFLLQMTPTDIRSSSSKKHKAIPFENENTVKLQFLDILDNYRNRFGYDPKDGRTLWKYLKNAGYEAKYAHVNLCFDVALQQTWFTPMKRVRKGSANVNNADDEDEEYNVDNEEGVEYVLQVDHEQLQRVKKERTTETSSAVVAMTAMDDSSSFVKKTGELSDDEYGDILQQYSNMYKNAPVNPAQVMNFTKTFLNIGYRYSMVKKAMFRHQWQEQQQ